MNKKVRTRFAPSPTGGLHLGGVRTALFNYLFARQQGGEFILRIEDTDQNRFVPGAEAYIMDCLRWCSIPPDESPADGGPYGPYRQSERKAMYRDYALQLVNSGKAYYAFDTPEELAAMRETYKTAENPTPQYNQAIRQQMRNSLALPDTEVQELLQSGTPYVIRVKMPDNQTISFTDLIKGEISFNTSQLDDKVLLKADGMPTYHLAVVVDDYSMKISHVLRGEEWLPSAPLHLLLWEYLGWKADMPEFGHLPLILGPNGKLSKRDGAKYGFPVYAMNWTDPETGVITEGFREKGFLPEAFINMLIMIGWNEGTEQEIFTLDELREKFRLDRIQKHGGRFDYEKARWFNHEWMQRKPEKELAEYLFTEYNRRHEHGMELPENQRYLTISANLADYCLNVVRLIRSRATLLTDLWEEGKLFFVEPLRYDTEAIRPKWNEQKSAFFREFKSLIADMEPWDSVFAESAFKKLAADMAIKPGELQLPFRVMLVGGKFGPPVFDIMIILGKDETIRRIENALPYFES